MRIDSFYAEIKEKAHNRVIFLERDFLTDVFMTTQILEYLFNIVSAPFQVLFLHVFFFLPALQYCKSMSGSSGELVA